MNEVLRIAKSCRHYAMCKIDFLDTGLCSSGAEKHYVSFYPQGRMDLYAALAEQKIPVTEKCIEIADSCDLCGKCDYQCYFVTEMKPSLVMKALKEHIRLHLNNGGKVAIPEKDTILDELKEIVGDYWVTNDRAVALTYSHDPSPLTVPKMPAYVIMPNSTTEISSVIKLLNRHKIPYAVRLGGKTSLIIKFLTNVWASPSGVTLYGGDGSHDDSNHNHIHEGLNDRSLKHSHLHKHSEINQHKVLMLHVLLIQFQAIN